MDIPAQAPVQPAIVNPVAAVKPVVANANDNMPQPAGAFQHLGAPPVQMGFPGGHGMAQAPIYFIPLGPAPSSMLMPQILMIPVTPLESLTDAELCAMEGNLRNAIITMI
ncbi:hypothetical protein BASA83_012539 [Batrachochytrium salamandrivorans]|nr:hypothetical protein BASA83_012539 [Batrachochytrium salamandrivorans]